MVFYCTTYVIYDAQPASFEIKPASQSAISMSVSQYGDNDGDGDDGDNDDDGRHGRKN